MNAKWTEDLRGRNVFPMRISGYTRKDLEDVGGIGPAPLAEDLIEAGLGYARCKRCDTAVPFKYGDLRGKPPLHYVFNARARALSQRCNSHEPVLIGFEAAAQPPVSSGTEGEAATRKGDAGERTEPPAPVPAQARNAPRQRAVPPSVVAAEKRTAAVASLRDIPGVVRASELAAPAAAVPVFKAGPDVDCVHENFRGVKGVCPDCKQWVGGKR